MEVETIDTLVAQNKALSQQINLLNSKLGNMQLAAVNTQIESCDLCGVQGHSSESCASILEQQSTEQVNNCDLCGFQGHSSESCVAILEQQSTEQVNYMGNGPRHPDFDPHSKTYNPGWRHHPNFGWGGQGNQSNQGQRQYHNNFQKQPSPLVQPLASQQPSQLEITL
ncbi:hypothetical protein PIB30_059813 [Stylosanthes scabra]|uniref:CCHC-type domain-containing protein n=1 Tax=Stylosanthes scabra TaxID=79078 RepID=A0ABU6QM61_9FABA|nr:hypothetical protein [Stylosanthes scabra]